MNTGPLHQYLPQKNHAENMLAIQNSAETSKGFQVLVKYLGFATDFVMLFLFLQFISGEKEREKKELVKF